MGGRGCVLCQFIEVVTFARFAFIFALRTIALGSRRFGHWVDQIHPNLAPNLGLDHNGMETTSRFLKLLVIFLTLLTGFYIPT